MADDAANLSRLLKTLYRPAPTDRIRAENEESVAGILRLLEIVYECKPRLVSSVRSAEEK